MEGGQMARTNSEVTIAGRFNMSPSNLVIKQITSSDTASAAEAATYRFQSRERELRSRFEAEMQAIRDAYLAELAGLELEE
jgi:hypothetical protein